MSGDKLRDMFPCSCVLMGGGPKEKQMFLCMVGPEAVKKGVHAGKIIKEVCGTTGGKGGGRPTLAQGGAPSSDKLDNDFAAAPKIFEELMTKGK